MIYGPRPHVVGQRNARSNRRQPAPTLKQLPNEEVEFVCMVSEKFSCHRVSILRRNRRAPRVLPSLEMRVYH